MRTAAICPTCATYTNSVCVIYDGPYLSNLGISPTSSLDNALQQINSVAGTFEKTANKSTNITADQSSNVKYPSVKAVYDWVTANFQSSLGFTPENVANKSTNVSLGTSNTLYPTQNAVKTYVDAAISAIPTPTSTYLVYTALISTSGGAISSVVVLENTLGQTITWTVPSNGRLRATSTGTPFTVGKTWMTSGGFNNGSSPMIVTSAQANISPTTRVDFNFFSYDGTQTGTPNIDNYSVEIRVYP